MKKINKAMLDELIRLTRKYYKTGDVDILEARNNAAFEISTYTFGNSNQWLSLCNIASALYGCNSLVSNADNQVAYDVFATLGFEIVEDES